MLSSWDVAAYYARTAEISAVTLAINTIFFVFHVNKTDLCGLQVA